MPYKMNPGLTSLLLVSNLISCTVNPVVYSPSGGVASLGWSIGTKVESESASITYPEGITIAYNRDGKDEVAIPRAYMQSQLGASLGTIAGNVVRHSSTQITRRATEDAITRRTAITAPLNATTENLRVTSEARP